MRAPPWNTETWGGREGGGLLPPFLSCSAAAHSQWEGGHPGREVLHGSALARLAKRGAMALPHSLYKVVVDPIGPKVQKDVQQMLLLYRWWATQRLVPGQGAQGGRREGDGRRNLPAPGNQPLSLLLGPVQGIKSSQAEEKRANRRAPVA